MTDDGDFFRREFRRHWRRVDRLLRNLGRRVAELRRARGFTQRQLGERLRVSEQYITRIEAGRNMTVLTVGRLAHALGVPVAEVFQPPTTRAKRRRGRPKGNGHAVVARAASGRRA